ncbi:MAG: NUDIX hydrolase [Deltaproteobacteria bacterium]|nr:NUDIX hydrolase [Deltaproteobacteria bacterium]
MPIVAVGAIVLDAAGKALLVERARAPGAGLWTVPGGKVETGETLVQAVVREVLEETGIVVEVGALACVVERIGEGYHYIILDYCARAVGGHLEAASDVRAARWVTPAELAGMTVTDGLHDVLAQARATHGAWFASR